MDSTNTNISRTYARHFLRAPGNGYSYLWPAESCDICDPDGDQSVDHHCTLLKLEDEALAVRGLRTPQRHQGQRSQGQETQIVPFGPMAISCRSGAVEILFDDREYNNTGSRTNGSSTWRPPAPSEIATGCHGNVWHQNRHQEKRLTEGKNQHQQDNEDHPWILGIGVASMLI